MMNRFFFVFIGCILLLCILVGIAVMFADHDSDDDGLRDEEGRHAYYDRSIIEKDKFRKEHPEVDHNDIRSFRRLFHWLTHKK